MATRALAVSGASLLLVAACSDEPPPLCDAEELTDALESAGSGDTVRVGSCRVRGSFTVPAGVSLTGAGRDVSILEGLSNTVAVFLEPGNDGSATRLADLAVESDGPADLAVPSDGTFAIGARGDGQGVVALEAVDVRAQRGFGMGAQDLSDLEMTDVTLTGQVTPENAAYSPDGWATHGLALLRIGEAALTDVTVTGFMEFGAALVETSTTWIGGGAPRNIGAGLSQWDGDADLQGLDLSETLERGIEFTAAAGIFSSGARVESVGLVVNDGQAYGLFHDNASAAHVDLVANDNDWPAASAQFCTSFEISGSAGELARNGQAGLTVIESTTVAVAGARIAETTPFLTLLQVGDEQVQDEMADGLQIVGPIETLTLQRLVVANNGRVGILIDLKEGGADIGTSDVTVEGTGEQLGAIAQQGNVPDGWDSGVTRQGATAENDPARTEMMGVKQIIDPEQLPQLGAIEEDLGLR
ncbi:MAG: hypothetical protein HYY06_30865 [Deltaproteobacteria bacterium]|nr:hypothetical protein [Deltaproteobacteria bacterium]